MNHLCRQAAAGAVMNIIAVACLCLAVNTWGDAIFDFKTLPEIFRNGTITLDDLRALGQWEA